LKNAKFSPAIRSFALTLQFYSSKAYTFVRKHFNNLLPHPSTLRKWYCVIKGELGFTEESFAALKARQNQSSDPVIINISIDEMAIRKHISFLNGRFYGGVDLGTGNENDSNCTQEATNALVFLAVCINSHWKIPLGYFLIHSFSGFERASLLIKCLELLVETGVKCYSITVDGAASNISMCKSLGANFEYTSANFKPWIEYPGSQNKIFIFWDACHMIKLVRNTLGDKKILINKYNEPIKWSCIADLHRIQESKGLHAANKLKKPHIQYYENKMNVRLCVQTLSASVSSSLLFCEQLNLINEVKATAEFCQIFNDAFDLLNCRNKYAKGEYNCPINYDNIEKIENFLETFKTYVEGLRYGPTNNDANGEQLIKSKRQVGFIGLIICLTNLINTYKVVKEEKMTYLLSYKLSQDHLEIFFSAMRSRGGFNNNPNAIQFRSAYKRLIVRHEVNGSIYGNCTQLDSSSILFVSAKKRQDADAIMNNDNDIDNESDLFEEFEHDYDYRMPELEEYVTDVVKYTSGFIVRKIKKNKKLCIVCDSMLTVENNENASRLLKLKTRGKLITPTTDVHKICLTTEYIIRMNLNILLTHTNIKQILIVKTTNEICHDSTIFNSQLMKTHILNKILWTITAVNY